jgi:hypothetical protein
MAAQVRPEPTDADGAQVLAAAFAASGVPVKVWRFTRTGAVVYHGSPLGAGRRPGANGAGPGWWCALRYVATVEFLQSCHFQESVTASWAAEASATDELASPRSVQFMAGDCAEFHGKLHMTGDATGWRPRWNSLHLDR